MNAVVLALLIDKPGAVTVVAVLKTINADPHSQIHKLAAEHLRRNCGGITFNFLVV